MNFPGKFDVGTVEKTALSLSDHAHFNQTPELPSQPHGAIVVPDAVLLFSGDFSRSGNDLILKNLKALGFDELYKEFLAAKASRMKKRDH